MNATWRAASRKVISAAAAALLLLAFAAVGVARAVGVSAATQTTLYASPAGSGSACSQSAPCSLAGAQAAVRTMNSSMTGDIVVQLMGGTYRLSSTVQFGPHDSGTNGHTVYWEAYPGQTSVISGATQVTGWSQYNSGLNIWRAPVRAGTQARDLWVNGMRATETQSAINPGGFSQSGASFTTSDSSYLSWSNPAEVEMVATTTRGGNCAARCPASPGPAAAAPAST